MKYRMALLLAAMGLFLVVVGCGAPAQYENPERSTVEGTLTLDGSPVGGALISFIAADDMRKSTAAISSPDGTFTAQRVPRGKVVVSVTTENLKEGPDGPTPPGFLAVPKKYWNPETSGLTLEIAKGDNTGRAIALTSN